MKQLQLYNKIIFLPANLRSEVNDFIDFLLSKKPKKDKESIPQFGCLKGQIVITDDFDEPLDDFKEYM
jgi:hypothetical protein